VGGVERIVVASSDKAYGESDAVPLVESAPLLASHPYDASKACAELVCRAYRETYGLPLAVTRCGNLFGARDLNWNRLVPGTIRSALRGERPVIRSDGLLVRDWFYVDDAVAAYRVLAERLQDGGVTGEAFNFSNEDPRSVLDVARTVLSRLGSELLPSVLARAGSEIRVQSLSSAKARERLSWRPLFSLESGLDATISWYRGFLSRPGDAERIAP
jgi:CDP-glucose 4,6-dehydratase